MPKHRLQTVSLQWLIDVANTLGHKMLAYRGYIIKKEIYFYLLQMQKSNFDR